MTGRLALVVPVRSLSGGKTRLGPDATPELRAALTARMLRHVLAAAVESGSASDILLVSPDPDALAVAREFGPAVTAVVQPVEQQGLNPAIDIGRAAAIAGGANAMMVLFADLPLLQADDVRAIASPTAPLVLAPDRNGTGTNGLRLDLTGPGRDFPFRFGEGSAAAHRAEAAALGLETATVRTPGTTFDLDTPSDLRELLARLDDAWDIPAELVERLR
ncbi:MAG: 2-phospho-L-lactate guanylyltransferase [Thermomicrobiales bacterium]